MYSLWFSFTIVKFSLMDFSTPYFSLSKTWNFTSGEMQNSVGKETGDLDVWRQNKDDLRHGTLRMEPGTHWWKASILIAPTLHLQIINCTVKELRRVTTLTNAVSGQSQNCSGNLAISPGIGTLGNFSGKHAITPGHCRKKSGHREILFHVFI